MGFKVSETDLNKAFATFGCKLGIIVVQALLLWSDIEDFRMLDNKNCAFIQ